MRSLSSGTAALAAFLVAALLSRRATAVPDAAEPTVDHGPETHHGLYIAPEVKSTMVTDDVGVLVGGQGGWLIDHRFVVGLAGYGLTTTHSTPRALDPAGPSDISIPSNVGMGYGGLRLAYVLTPDALVHGVFGAVIGGGRVTATSLWSDPRGQFETHHRAVFFTVEPLAELELNVDRNFRVALAASWRYVAPTGIAGLSSAELGGPAGSLVLRYGLF